MDRRGSMVWSADAGALGLATVVLAIVGGRWSSRDLPAGLVVAWFAVISGTLVVVTTPFGRRPPRPVGAGAVVLTYIIPSMAALDVAASLRVAAFAFGAGFALSLAMFTAGVIGHRSTPATGLLLVATLIDVGARLWLRDPFLDVRCNPFCRDNPLLISARPGLVLLADRTLAVAALGWCVIAVVQIVTSPSAPTPKASGSFAVVAAGMTAAMTLAPVEVATAKWSQDWGSGLVAAVLVPTLLLAAVPTFQVIRTRRRVRALASDLAAGFDRDGVAGHLRRAMADPAVRLVFPDATGSFIDRNGAPTDLASQDTVTTTVLTSGKATIAVVEHAPSSTPLIEAAFNPAVTIAAENERLHAEAQAHLGELQRSRRRIVERSDETRRRLERDLHDGAQQRLLLLGLELSSPSGTTNDADPHRHGAALRQAQEALHELRRLVHDPSPPVLDEFGLVEALRSMAEGSSIPLLLELEAPLDRPSSSIERVAFRLAQSAVSEADTHGASGISIRLTGRGERFAMSIRHDGGAAPVDHIDAEDRVGAVGGTLEVVITDDGVSYSVRFP